MKIVDVVCSKARTGFFFDDQRAIKKGAVSDGAAYFGETVTPGFKSVRQAGEAISVMLILEDGTLPGVTVQPYSIPVQADVTRCFWQKTLFRLLTNISNRNWLEKRRTALRTYAKCWKTFRWRVRDCTPLSAME